MNAELDYPSRLISGCPIRFYIQEPTMAKSPEVATLAKLVKQLQAQRQEHLDAIDQIDSAFDDLGLEGASGNPGRKKAKNGRRTKGSGAKGGRRKFKMTAEEMVYQLLKKNKTMTTGQINKQWTKAGRGGNADNTLSKMTREKRVKRINIKGSMGSQYRLAG